jgi:uncharacterized protein
MTSVEEIKIIDSDTHVTEPADLWTSRLPRKWQEKAPQVAHDPATSEWRWRVGDTWLPAVGVYSHSGWHEFTPGAPPTIEDADPACWEPNARLKKMDEFGIYAQVLYPNIMGFESLTFMNDDLEFALACVTAYNDFQTEFASTDPERFIPITVVPFWDIDATVKEVDRCTAMGHKGVLWANKYEPAGLPSFVDKHWDPVYAACQERGLSINFHIGFSAKTTRTEEGREIQEQFGRLWGGSKGTRENPPRAEDAINIIRMSIPSMMGNATTITELLLSDVCARFPELNFVSVESGFGYVPYLLEAADWTWCNFGARDALPNRLLPSEYFLRQCYGSFWFESVTLPLLESFPDNFMFETDFPHPTSMTPGPASYGERPATRANNVVVDKLSPEVARKVLFENAAKLYHLAP